MRVGGGLRYVVGPMGAGKSLYGVRSIIGALLGGRYAITNVRLVDDYADKVARHVTRSRAKRTIVRDKLERFYVHETGLDKATRYYPAGKGEARALMLWDEAHNDLNNRTYRDRDQWLLEWATQLRKFGFEGVLLSQSAENTDAQLRRICNYMVKVQNQRETTRLPLIHTRIPFLPRLFLAAWYDVNALGMGSANVRSLPPPIKVERYLLGYYGGLYDTHALFHGVAEMIAAGEMIVLPEGGRRADAERRARPLHEPSMTLDPSGSSGTV